MELYPRVRKTVWCLDDHGDVLTRTADALRQEDDVRIVHADPKTLVVAIKNTEVLGYSSFLPRVQVCAFQENKKTRVEITAGLQRGVKILLSVMIVLLALFTTTVSILMLVGKTASPLALLILAGLAVFLCLLTYLGLRFSSRWILRLLTTLIKGNSADE